MIVLDASILIGHLDAKDAQHDLAVRILEDAGADELGASPITIAEVLVGPARTGKLERAMSALSQLEVQTLGLAHDAPMKLAVLRAGTGLKLPDCCVLLAAEQSSGEIASLDVKLRSAAANLGFAVRGA